MAIDWTDPCARALALRSAYFDLIRGASESLIRHSTTEGDQEVRYTRADVDKLKAEMTSAETECAIANGQNVPRRAQRFAISGGGRRPGWPSEGC